MVGEQLLLRFRPLVPSMRTRQRGIPYADSGCGLAALEGFMARAVKDLRELINVSRLSFREEEHSYASLPDLESGLQRTSLEEKVHDSVAKEHSPLRGSSRSAPVHKGVQRHKAASSTTSSQVQPQGVSSQPPPHITLGLQSRSAGGGDWGKGATQGAVEDVVAHIDKDYLKELLVQSNTSVAALSLWWADPIRACKFMHFWLKEIDDRQRLEFLQMEYSIVREEVQALFAVPLAVGEVKMAAVHSLLHSVLHEYPSAFCGAKGRKAVVDVIRVLASEKKDEFKRLLTHVHLSSSNKPAIESILSLRSFGLVSMMYSVVCFFCKAAQLDLPGATAAAVDVNAAQHCHSLVHAAVSAGFSDVLLYLWETDRHSFGTVDDHGRSPVFLAVQQHQECALKLLLEKVGITCIPNKRIQ